MSKEVVIYGASGYTGKLIAWHMAELGIPFIAAGRSQQRLEEQMAKVPEVEGHDYECVEVANDRESLAALFAGKKVVYNVVGPFMQLAGPVVEACLDAGCHYLDTTGEQDWMFHVKRTWGQQFADKGLVVIPAMSYMWVAGQLAAEIALEDPAIDSLDLMYLADSYTSVASTMSFMRMLVNDQFFLHNRELEVWPRATPYPVHSPDLHMQLQALPWGGGGEVVWYENDDRVSNCSVLVAFKNQAMVGVVIDMVKRFEEKYSHLEGDEREQQSNQMGNEMVSEEPGREDPDINRSIISCIARGNTETRNVIMRGNSPYLQTAAFAAEATRQLLLAEHNGAGALSPCHAFGHRKLIACAASRGYLTWNATSN